MSHEMYEQMKKLFDDREIRFSAPKLVTSINMPTWEGVVSVDVVASPFVPDGYIYLMDYKQQFGYAPIPADFDQSVFEELSQRMIARAFGVPSDFFHFPLVQEAAGRELGLIAWGEGLDKLGLLDNPDIRWVYQKAVAQAILAVPVSAFKRLKSWWR